MSKCDAYNHDELSRTREGCLHCRKGFDPGKVERPFVKEWGHHAVYMSDYDQLLELYRAQKTLLELCLPQKDFTIYPPFEADDPKNT